MIRMNRRTGIIIAAGIIVLIAVAGVVTQRLHEKAIARNAALAQLHIKETARASIERSIAEYFRGSSRFVATFESAYNFGMKRHEDSLSEHPSSEKQKNAVKAEQTAVRRASSAAEIKFHGIEQSIDTLESVFGADAVKGARANAANFREAESISITETQIAVDNIVDAYVENKQPDSLATEAIEGHYTKGAESRTQAQKFELAALQDEKTLRDRLDKEIADIKASLK